MIAISFTDPIWSSSKGTLNVDEDEVKLEIDVISSNGYAITEAFLKEFGLPFQYR